ncbi:DUF222 domain-containing protein [Aeromicrobium sp. CF4.19]|uniref:DUF222 domain-containing protein n=1 Tax=Aeromicrobium sp. CF4.19 TaxID=3373082 RepID=UPI003EE7E47D
MDTTQAPSSARITELAGQRAQAEAGEWTAMVAFRDAELARIDALESPLRRLAERAGVVLEIAQSAGLSEAQVHARLAVADRVHERAPRTWLAFQAGRVDAARVREISSTLDRLERVESWLRLDGSVIAYATGHTVAELRVWLKRFVLRVEEDLQRERAEKAREDRHVEVVHVEDSMAWLNAYLPSRRRGHRQAPRPRGQSVGCRRPTHQAPEDGRPPRLLDHHQRSHRDHARL